MTVYCVRQRVCPNRTTRLHVQQDSGHEEGKLFVRRIVRLVWTIDVTGHDALRRVDRQTGNYDIGSYLFNILPTFSLIFNHLNPSYTHLCGLEIILILSSDLRLDFRSSLLPSSYATDNINPFLGPKTVNRYCGTVRVNVGLGVMVMFPVRSGDPHVLLCFHKVILITRKAY
jgi:hypothetical protein